MIPHESAPETRLRMLLVDDEPVFREGLQAVLEPFANSLQVVGEAISAEEAVTAALALQPDVVLFDLRLPEDWDGNTLAWEHGVAAITRIAAAAPVIRILVLSYLEEPDVLFAALSAGAHGYIAKGDRFDGKALLQAVQKIVAGETIYGPLVAQHIREYYRYDDARAKPFEPLTVREREVLDLLIQRRSNQQIAEQLVISVPTVKSHVSNILAKLQLRRREEVLWQQHRERREPPTQ
jgi:DNA-binding NarL/FixJ family response regulator